ncbi:ABC-2 transporter permease [Ruminococcus sp.]|uniref:ABC-2 transporter permease n=1 Tax=Ruminococcus sp. TaxID=41978 RepID=UPI0025DC5435|nr:ABC-2 transporter permease [Ruminococcus sp.]MBQ8965002.1 ABC-2 transporter permease [Ruminococcus sp.]
MKGLLIKEKYTMWHNCALFLLVPLFFFAAMLITLFGRHSTIVGFPVGMVFMFMGIVPVNTSNNDIQSKWHMGCMTLPYSRRQIVSAKYISSLILVTGTAVVWLIFMGICSLLGANVTAGTVTSLLCSGFGLGLMPAVAFLPFNFKWYDTVGGKRIFLGGLTGGLVGFSNIFFLNHIPGIMGSVVFMSVMVIAFFVSWFISIRIFERKDV